MMAMPIWFVSGLWILWMLQFALFLPKQRGTAVKSAPRSRWGIVLQVLGYWAILLPARMHWTEPISVWRMVAGSAFGLLGIWLASAGVRHLGKQWRSKAALNADHELVMSGPYQVVRHPIYASMITMAVMSALFLGRLPWWPIGIALFLAGIEVRVHVEDGLLRDHFGAKFEEWKQRVPAYLPLIR
jgi:protein-S-isoprenylcysteine O-methyltransferase Ste14